MAALKNQPEVVELVKQASAKAVVKALKAAAARVKAIDVTRGDKSDNKMAKTIRTEAVAAVLDVPGE
jgi:hypothetical protein